MTMSGPCNHSADKAQAMCKSQRSNVLHGAEATFPEGNGVSPNSAGAWGGAGVGVGMQDTQRKEGRKGLQGHSWRRPVMGG